MPFALSTLDRPRALLADPGLPLDFDAAPLWQQVLGQPLSFDAAGGLSGLALFAGGPVPWALLLALLIGARCWRWRWPRSLFPHGAAGVARALWVAALIAALAGGWLAGHVATGAGAQALVTPFAGPAVSAAVFALLGAALIGGDGLLALAGAGSRRSVGPCGGRRAGAPSCPFHCGAGHGAPAGRTAGRARGLDGAKRCPAGRTAERPAADRRPRDSPAGGCHDPRMLPATAIDRGEGPEQTRTLLISTGEDGTYSASLMRGGGTTLDGLSTIASARDIRANPARNRSARTTKSPQRCAPRVATLVAGHGVDPRPELERLGVGFVVLRAADTAAQLTASRMDAVPGLVAVGPTDSGWLWRVSPLNQAVLQPADVAHRVRIIDGKGATTNLLPSGLTDVDSRRSQGSRGPAPGARRASGSGLDRLARRPEADVHHLRLVPGIHAASAGRPGHSPLREPLGACGPESSRPR